MGTRGVMNPALTMWLPPLIIFICSIFLIYFSLKEKTFDILIVWNFIKNLRKKKKK